MTSVAGHALLNISMKDKAMAKKKIANPNVVASTALAAVPTPALIPLLGSEHALAKMPGSGGNVAREGGVTLVTGRAYATADRLVPASEIFFEEGAKPRGEGPWLGEADKVSWRDGETGFECIMMRETGRGHLSGYVGVPKDHPLWGWSHEAIPADLGIDVHGGLTYSQICEEGPSPARRLVMERRRICHVPRIPYQYEPVTHATEHRPEDEHVWWFGFSCDHVYDIVPGDRGQPKRFMGAETGAEYRDDSYVVGEILNLARQLRAIGDGTAVPPREGPQLPAIGLDPKRGG